MAYFFSMLGVLLIGMPFLMAGSYMLNNEQGLGRHKGFMLHSEQALSPNKAIIDSVAWGVGFLVSFGAEFIAIANVL